MVRRFWLTCARGSDRVRPIGLLDGAAAGASGRACRRAARGAGPRGGGRGAPPVKSPEMAADGRVTFRLRAPNAKEVAVAMGGNRLAMQKDEQGVWTVTSDVLAPDYYTYALVVDGTSINDPANRLVQTSFAGFQSMFVVPGAASLAAGAGGGARRDRPASGSDPRSRATSAIISSTPRPATMRGDRVLIRCCSCCTAWATMRSDG